MVEWFAFLGRMLAGTLVATGAMVGLHAVSINSPLAILVALGLPLLWFIRVPFPRMSGTSWSLRFLAVAFAVVVCGWCAFFLGELLFTLLGG